MSEKIYTLLLQLYPASFRNTYREEALQLFRDRSRDEGSVWEQFRLWFDLLSDVAFSLPRVYRRPRTMVARLSGHPVDQAAPFFCVLKAEGPNPASMVCAVAVSFGMFALLICFIARGGRAALSENLELGRPRVSQSVLMSSLATATVSELDASARQRSLSPLIHNLQRLSFNRAPVQAAAPAVQVTTSQYDNARTGADVHETILSPKNVNPDQFGKLRSLAVDGDVYAQPLYVPGLNIPGKGVHNVLFVATEHDSVYAFDADTNSPDPLWHVSLLPAGKLGAPVRDVDVRCPFISPEVGITSTPVIDMATGTLYVLVRAKTWTSRSDIQYRQDLHALAITTGVEKFGGPVEIRASVAGVSTSSSGGQVRFDPLRENPRSALLLVDGSVYLTWASSCDVGPYHGWVMAYDARTLRQQAVLNTSPNADESGIWLGDAGPAADTQGNVYVVTGNGQFDANTPGGRDYGDTALKLHLQGNQLHIESYFTPYDQEHLNSDDLDLGSGGPLLLPGGPSGKPGGIVLGGKAGVMYVVDPEQMGGFHRGSDTVPEKIRLSTGILTAPASWNGHLYYYSSEVPLKEFVVAHGRVSALPAHQSAEKSPFSGSTPTVSANGTADGIVWLVESRAWDRGGTPATLRAYDALDVHRLIYSSEQNASRDRAGEAVRFAIPTVANGHVYFGVKKAVEVYGLLAKGAK